MRCERRLRERGSARRYPDGREAGMMSMPFNKWHDGLAATKHVVARGTVLHGYPGGPPWRSWRPEAGAETAKCRRDPWGPVNEVRGNQAWHPVRVQGAGTKRADPA